MAKSYFISFFITLCAVLVESTILSNISFLLVIPDLVLICSIYFSILNGRLYGEINGVTSGLLLDFITGVPMGFNCFYRTLIGYLFGLFTDSIIISGVIIPMLTVGIGTIAKRLFILLLSFFYPRNNLQIYGFISYNFLFEFIINILLAPLIFKFLSFFNKNLSIKNTKDMIDNVK